ncbi:related to GCR1-dependent translation factor 1 [Zygosaccharomyces bailii]|nr:related to GCR1-dependent translation factor 1 [Zygosaccharomyces bailii]
MSIYIADAEGDVTEGHTALASFYMAVSMIAVSEIGDKTFLMGALMAMRHPKWIVFTSSFCSLAIMTILSGIAGHAFVSVISERYTRYFAGLLFLVFAYKLTLEGLHMPKDAGVDDELAEVEEEITAQAMNTKMHDLESGKKSSENYHGDISYFKLTWKRVEHWFSIIFSPLWIQLFSMIFLGEFGDRSQVSIIAMASHNDYWLVIFGAVTGHFICSFLAVIGGKLLATRISMRSVTFGGALSFFVFAVRYIYEARHMV